MGRESATPFEQSLVDFKKNSFFLRYPQAEKTNKQTNKQENTTNYVCVFNVSNRLFLKKNSENSPTKKKLTA